MIPVPSGKQTHECRVVIYKYYLQSLFAKIENIFAQTATKSKR